MPPPRQNDPKVGQNATRFLVCAAIIKYISYIKYTPFSLLNFGTSRESFCAYCYTFLGEN